MPSAAPADKVLSAPEFNKEVLAAMAKLKVTFDEEVVEECQPKEFLDVINNQ